MEKSTRTNQKYRTRKDLLLAASRLLKDGRNPTMAEVADEARVSRATAYRYFPNVEFLLGEVPMDQGLASADDVFAGVTSRDPVERVCHAEAAVHEIDLKYPAQLRLMLANSVKQNIENPGDGSTPRRQNRRSALIEKALEPVRDRIDPRTYRKLCAALAHFFGTESMIVFQDVLRLPEKETRQVKAWALRALVEQALDEQES